MRERERVGCVRQVVKRGVYSAKHGFREGGVWVGAGGFKELDLHRTRKGVKS